MKPHKYSRMDNLEFSCPDCVKHFKSASALLEHFVIHASNETLNSGRVRNGPPPQNSRRALPDLVPIKQFNATAAALLVDKVEVENDSGIEDMMNPLKFCLVTMDETANKKTMKNPRKYVCNYCNKRFGWSTDLKRHIMIHTGERPFSCRQCDSKFTRNFLLVKHEKKCH